MEGRPLEAVHEERDLAIMITKYLKCSKQCLNAAKAANKILGMIKRTFTCKSAEIILQLYKSLVRPRLEYCIQAWCSHLRNDIDLLEKMQRRATWFIYSLYDLPYYDRLNPLDAGRRLTDFSQTSYAAGSRLTYKTVNQRSGS